MNQDVQYNIKAHDKVALRYEYIHTEIYNEVEQGRLNHLLRRALGMVDNCADKIHVLDFGCGAGNLSQHLLDMGCFVEGADISENFLKLVRARFSTYGERFKTHQLNGENVDELVSESYDMVVLYSVLHHIPEYLETLNQLIRLIKPGGVLVIEHERNENYWSEDPILKEYLRYNRWYRIRKKFPRLFTTTFWKTKCMRLINSRYQSEGDIHVYQDDHIEWDKITDLLERQNTMQIVYCEDYLVYDSVNRLDLYREYSSLTSDTRVVVAKKI